MPSPAPVKTEVAWYRIDPGDRHGAVAGAGQRPDPLVLLPFHRGQQGRRRAIGFSGSSTTEFVGGYYTARRFSRSRRDAEPVALLKAGEAPYFKTSSGVENRWGDFSATVVDPTDDRRSGRCRNTRRPPIPPRGHPGGEPGGENSALPTSSRRTTSSTAHAGQPLGPVDLERPGDQRKRLRRGTEDRRGGTFGSSPPRRCRRTASRTRISRDLAGDDVLLSRRGGRFHRHVVPRRSPGRDTGRPRARGRRRRRMPVHHPAPEARTSFATSLFSAGILLLPAFALGLRRFSRRRERTVPIRHPLC